MDLPTHILDESQKGRLVILAGPSGVGKSSVVHELKTQIPDLFFSVSVTTRPPREGESHGEDYFFITAEEFDSLVDKGGLLEWAWIHNGLQRSGTPLAPIAAAIKDNKPVLVEVDLAGAEAIKTKLPWADTVFLMPPNWNELKARLKHRGSETDLTLARRLHTAKWEMLHAAWFDQIIINSDVAQTVALMEPLFLK